MKKILVLFILLMTALVHSSVAAFSATNQTPVQLASGEIDSPAAQDYCLGFATQDDGHFFRHEYYQLVCGAKTYKSEDAAGYTVDSITKQYPGIRASVLGPLTAEGYKQVGTVKQAYVNWDVDTGLGVDVVMNNSNGQELPKNFCLLGMIAPTKHDPQILQINCTDGAVESLHQYSGMRNMTYNEIHSTLLGGGYSKVAALAGFDLYAQ